MIPQTSPEPEDTERTNVAPDGRPAAQQPQWRQDFPISLPEDEYVARRELVKFVVLISGAFTVGQFWIVLRSLLRPAAAQQSAELELGPVEELAIGAAKTFEYPPGSTPRLLVRTGPEAFVAYDQQCTHLLCPVVPAVSEGKLHCPCHNGWFDLASGRPIAGPPQRALARITLALREGKVWATGVEEPAR